MVSTNDKGNLAAAKVVSDGEFEYYAIYLPEVDSVMYVPIDFGGKYVRCKPPKRNGKFYWYKDFTIGNHKIVYRTKATMV